MPPRSSSASTSKRTGERQTVAKTKKAKAKTPTPLPPPSQWAHLIHPSLLAAATRHMKSIHPDIVGAAMVSRPSSLGLHAVTVRYPKSEHACPIRKQPHKSNIANVNVVGKTRNALLHADETQVRFWYRCWDGDCIKAVRERSEDGQGAVASSVLLQWDAREGKSVAVGWE